MRFALVFLLAACTASVLARCPLACYRGSVTWADASTLDYAFSVVPCAPVTVASATMADGGDALVLPTFSCAAADGVVAITLARPAGAHLEWRYATDETCATVLAAISTIPGEFLGTAHTQHAGAPPITDGPSLESAQIQCTATTCTPLCFDSGILTLAGVAGDKSPCGLADADACPVRVQYTLSLCDQPPRVVALDVLLGSDGVRLANYQPSAVAAATLTCDDARLHLDAAGVALEWALPTDNGADCDSLLLQPNVLATGALHAATVATNENELWTAPLLGQSIAASPALCNAMPSTMPGTIDSTEPSPSATPLPTDDTPAPESNTPEAETVPTLDHAIVPHVYCSARRAGSQCCSVFGYTNPNTVGAVTLPTGRPQNFLVPKQAVVPGVLHFLHNTTVAAAYSVGWECEEYLQHKLRWVIETNAPRGQWHRSADADRNRNDCSTADYNTWCT